MCACSPKSEDVRLKVATYNIQMSPDAKKNFWQTRKDAAKKLLDYYRFDIWGSQETFLHQIEYIIPSGYGFVGVGRDDGATKGEFSPIFYNKEKLEVLNSGTFWISETPEKVSFGWGAKYRRICTWGEFKDKKSGKVFFFFNTHLDHKVAKAQEEGVKLIVGKIEEITKDKPFILTGDFNIKLGDDKLAPIVNSSKFQHARDVSKTVPYGASGTYHAYSGVSKAFIDYIFTSKNIKVLKYVILTDRIGAQPCDEPKIGKRQDVDYASDHFPIVTEIEF